MALSRRDFMKLVGVSVSSLMLTRCRLPVVTTCYLPTLPPTEPPTARGRLRQCWQSFGELAQATIEESNKGTSDNTFGQALTVDHRAALDELVANGELTSSVADLVQEAFDAAVYHIWRSNALITCYEPVMVNYGPASAEVLVRQAELLEQVASQDVIDPATIDSARVAIEHDMAFYALTDEEVSHLYEKIIAEWQTNNQSPVNFDQVELEITPDAQAAAQFIISVLAGQ